MLIKGRNLWVQILLCALQAKKPTLEAKPDSRNIKSIGAGVRAGVCKGPKPPAPAWPVSEAVGSLVPQAQKPGTASRIITWGDT